MILRAPLALALAVSAWAAGAPSVARAHSLRFGVLRVRQVGSGATLTLRASGAEGVPPDLALSVGGPGCRLEGRPSRDVEGTALVLRARARCFEGLELRVEGLERSGVRVAVSVASAGGEAREVAFLESSSDTYVVGRSPPAPPVFRRYAELGVEHLALGFDHLLFLLALVLVVFDPRYPRERPVRDLFATVTGFTTGHALTLSLAILGGLTLPAPPVEVCIALSIVFLSVELIRRDVTIVFRRPWLVAAGFGLIHGLGFAGALRGLGVPEGDAAEALVAFHVGLELAQLLFVSLALGALAVARRFSERRRVLAYAIGAAATVFLVSRAETLLG